MYRINEGSIDLPKDWQDRTINVLASNAAGSGVSLTITRDDMPWGMDFGEYVEDQSKQAATALKNFEVLDRRELTVNKAAAIELECRWTSRQGRVHQLITTVQGAKRQVMVLTASANDIMSDGQKKELRRIVSTLKLDRAGG